jgi:uncharacterized protein YndB with AHSA1/START domain
LLIDRLQKNTWHQPLRHLFVSNQKQIMETSNAIKLELSKSFTVPKVRLYQAWINPDDLKQWWHPMGTTLQEATTKPEVGAPVKYVFVAEEGAQSLTISGVYKEVAEGERLVYTWNWQLPTATVNDSEFLLTIVFSSENSGSGLSVTQENFSNDEAVQPHREGWEKALNDLDKFLSGQH